MRLTNRVPAGNYTNLFELPDFRGEIFSHAVHRSVSIHGCGCGGHGGKWIRSLKRQRRRQRDFLYLMLVVADGDDGGDDSGDDDGVTRVLSWDRTELMHLLELHEGVRRSLKAILSWDLVRKLKGQRALLKKNLIADAEEWTELRNQQTAHRYAAILHAILQHPALVERFRKEVLKYRMIHHVSDEQHARALAECGWTVEEYEMGKLKHPHKMFGDDDEMDHSIPLAEEEEIHNWKWYAQDIYLRVFG